MSRAPTITWTPFVTMRRRVAVLVLSVCVSVCYHLVVNIVRFYGLSKVVHPGITVQNFERAKLPLRTSRGSVISTIVLRLKSYFE